MVLLLVFLLSLCTNFDAKSMHDDVWAPIQTSHDQDWAPVHRKTVPIVSKKSETKSPSPELPELEEEDSPEESNEEYFDLKNLAEQVAHATLSDEESGDESDQKEDAPEDHHIEKKDAPKHVNPSSKTLPYIVSWHLYDSRAHNDLLGYLNAGYSVDVCDMNGFTGLHMAAYYGDVSAAQLLLKHGANFRLTNRYGQTALDIARMSKNLALINLFLVN